MEGEMERSAIGLIVGLGLVAATGCTGGDMGNTRGGGAAPGQSGGADTTHASAAGAAAGATTRTAADTTKQRAKATKP
jgi:hypothetical protein